MRKLIAAMKMSLDNKIAGPNGDPDWIAAWSEDYGLTPQIDACLLGGTMYNESGYEEYWTAIQQNEPGNRLSMTGRVPTPGEIEWARFAAKTPHYVLSTTLDSALWPNTNFIRSLDEVAALKHQPGKDIYLIGGAQTVANLIEAGLVDEIRLLVYPLIAGEGKALFAKMEHLNELKLLKVEQLKDGRASLTYRILPKGVN
ncbi:dihydrofolate reductase family protein [Olivibacter sp. SDN3]|uniref:dihydrofolate reductase family protein n=1 Tax=Olivibacter sp. SDN3 TaxID=2764720 RepID=UPI0016510AE3|nr:dihydrofolate reductase family protein [Olivibacter sp. SDN3]QNL52292.1 dihydrofolate reductase family protein [Olivibacter sp. SDN3]